MSLLITYAAYQINSIHYAIYMCVFIINLHKCMIGKLAELITYRGVSMQDFVYGVLRLINY